jgi:hypothetical protein
MGFRVSSGAPCTAGSSKLPDAAGTGSWPASISRVTLRAAVST